MSGPIIIEELKLSGFRAYLHQKIFKLVEKKSGKKSCNICSECKR